MAQRVLPDDQVVLTDGGIETVLIFSEGLDLPEFASFPLLDEDAGRETLRRYYAPFLDVAREHGTAFLLTAPTWRANTDWGARVGYDPEALAAVNRRAIEFLGGLRAEAHADQGTVLVEGLVGPRDDGYAPSATMTADEAELYHSAQLRVFADTDADLATAMTMTYADEATGVVRAATALGLPVAISFTLETDGRLPSGQPLADAITEVDLTTDGAAAYFMINCAHPTHFEDVLDSPVVRERVHGVRANASTRSHAELDSAEDLDDGDPTDLGARYAALRESLPNLTVVGGCCGTDVRHVRAIARSMAADQHSA